MKTNTEEPRHLINRSRLAQRWGVSIETLKRREKAGLLPCLKLGTSVRYRIEIIEAIEHNAEVSL